MGSLDDTTTHEVAWDEHMRVVKGLRSSVRHKSVRRVPYKRFKAKKNSLDLIGKEQGILMIWVQLHIERKKVQRAYGARKGALYVVFKRKRSLSEMALRDFIKSLSDN